MNTDANYDALAQALFSYAVSRSARLVRDNVKLAHYTTAENALNIVTGETIGLRNAAIMSDHSEIQHGRSLLDAASAASALGRRLFGVLHGAHPGLAERIMEHMREQRTQARERVFMVSLSETDADDRLGRLSMWRAYGGCTSGAALVFNPQIFNDAQPQLQAFASPVLYGGYGEFAPRLEAIIHTLECEPHLLSNVSPDTAFKVVSSAFDYAILSIKHIGFQEEREWRVIHRPYDHTSTHIVKAVTSIAGTPQLVYQMPLVNRPGLNVRGLTLDRLLHRVLVGPSLHPETTWRALVEALRVKGVRAPESAW